MNATNKSKYESDRVITPALLWGTESLEQEGVLIGSALSIVFGGLITAMLSSLVSIYFLSLAAIPLALISLLVVGHMKNSLNVITEGFNCHSDVGISFNKRETAKLLLRLPTTKSFDCGENKVYALDRWGGRDYSKHSGVQRFEIKTIKNKLHMVKTYHEFPGYTWDEALKKATNAKDVLRIGY